MTQFLRLLRVELSRLAARRLVRVVAGLLLLGLLTVGVAQAVTHDRDLEGRRRDEVAQARTFAEQEYRHLTAACSDPAQRPPPEVCAELGDREQFVDGRVRNFVSGTDPRYVLVTDGPNDVRAAGVAVMIAAFVVGASFGGAEWAAGTMAALLFWEPRRLRVMLSKIVALGSAAFVAGVGAGLLQIGISTAVAAIRGTTANLPDGFYADLAETAVRGGALPVFSSLLAFGIAGLTRNTGAALGAAFVYFAILENLARALRPRWSPYLVGEQIGAWIEGRIELRWSQGPFLPERVFLLTRERAGTTLAVYVVIVLAVMTVLFARRDVT